MQRISAMNFALLFIEASSKPHCYCWPWYKFSSIIVSISYRLNLLSLRHVSSSLYLHFFFFFTCLLLKCIIVFSFPELSSENLRTCFQIVNAYLYLSATDFLQVTHTQMITVVYNFPLLCWYLNIFSFLFPSTELCRVVVSVLLWFTERHHKWGTGPSSEGTDIKIEYLALKITPLLLLLLTLFLDFYYLVWRYFIFQPESFSVLKNCFAV